MELKLQINEVPKEATLIVGVSGGRDSMALIHALRKQRPDINIIPAHVNHGLRSDADDDAAFVQGMMQRWELPCEVYKPRKAKTGNIEAWGRDKRYEFFNKLLKKHKAHATLTAHHQDDDFESMMLHFLRGTRVKGLSGMLAKRGNILRPLLFTPRSDIDAYIKAHDIHFREDPTNKDESLKRNFLRHKIIPVLNHVYPEMAARWQGQKDYWLALQEMLENSAESFLDKFLDEKTGLNREAYRELPFPLRATVLEIWFRESTGQRISDSNTLTRWDTAILTWHSRKKTEWGDKKFLVMSKERAKIS